MRFLQNNKKDDGTLFGTEKRKKTKKKPIFGSILGILPKNQALSFFYPKDTLTSCATSGKSYEPFWRKHDY